MRLQHTEPLTKAGKRIMHFPRKAIGRTSLGLKMVLKYCERVIITLAVIMGGLFWIVVSAHGAALPDYQGFVTDTANLISKEKKLMLEQELSEYEKKSSNEIAVVTVLTTGDISIEQFAVKLEEKWMVGKKEKDNGIIFIVAKNDRNMRIEVGYGLEGDLTDGDAGEIIRSVVVPRFRENNYEQGIIDGTRAILSELGEESSGAEQIVGNNPLRKSAGSKLDQWLSEWGPFLFFIPILIVYFISYMARTKEIIAGGIVGGLGGGLLGLLLGTVIGVAVTALIGGILGLVLDWLLSRNYKKALQKGRRTDWLHTLGGFSSGGWGSSSGGGGFGGFGGGSSGGGGASGGW